MALPSFGRQAHELQDDVEAKMVEFGGNPKVLIATPEIKAFRIKKDHDFIVLGCDGIFDRINNKEAVNVVWKCT